MNSKKTLMLLGTLLVASLVLAACQPATTPDAADADTSADVADEPAAAEEEEAVVDMGPVTLNRYERSDIPELDPQLSTDSISIDQIENLFVSLTNTDLVTSEIVGDAAISWTVSDDGTVYTFSLRDDIPWVYHNPITGETTQVVDDEGNPRWVNAHDFVNGMHRACNPDLGSYYSGIIAPVIVGCEATLFADDPEALTEEDYLAIGAVALDDFTVEYTLPFPAGYFLPMTTMWTMVATPAWTIAAFEENWTEAGNIVTNGAYVLNEWVHGVRWQLWRNPLMPEDMRGSGNVERIVVNVVPDTSTGYALWLAGEVDMSGIPVPELDAHLENFADETDQIADNVVFYMGFAHDKPPFDVPLVREAFAQAFDKATFIQDVRGGQGLVMTHFAPPAMFGAPPIDEVGNAYDPTAAAAKLAEAGYPNCEGFPQVSLLAYSGEATLRWIEFAQANFADNLGCSPDLFSIEQTSFGDLLAATSADAPTEDRPNIWTLGWGPDYPDENNWVSDVLYCLNPLDTLRPCTETDDLIKEAREEGDPARRIELYRQIETNFFGEGGEHPIIPIWLRIGFAAIHSWVDRIPAIYGGAQYYNYSIDQAAQFEMMQ